MEIHHHEILCAKSNNTFMTRFTETELNHRPDSNQDNDYNITQIVSRAKIENIKWKIRRDIILLTFGYFVTLKVQKLKILRNNKKCESRYWLQIRFFSNIASFYTNDVANFLKVNWIKSLPICHFRFSISVVKTVKFKKSLAK